MVPAIPTVYILAPIAFSALLPHPLFARLAISMMCMQFDHTSICLNLPVKHLRHNHRVYRSHQARA